MCVGTSTPSLAPDQDTLRGANTVPTGLSHSHRPGDLPGSHAPPCPGFSWEHFCSNPCVWVCFWTQPSTVAKRGAKELAQREVLGRYDEAGPGGGPELCQEPLRPGQEGVMCRGQRRSRSLGVSTADSAGGAPRWLPVSPWAGPQEPRRGRGLWVVSPVILWSLPLCLGRGLPQGAAPTLQILGPGAQDCGLPCACFSWSWDWDSGVSSPGHGTGCSGSRLCRWPPFSGLPGAGVHGERGPSIRPCCLVGFLVVCWPRAGPWGPGDGRGALGPALGRERQLSKRRPQRHFDKFQERRDLGPLHCEGGMGHVGTMFLGPLLRGWQGFPRQGVEGWQAGWRGGP